jgi:hypothetical protein
LPNEPWQEKEYLITMVPGHSVHSTFYLPLLSTTQKANLFQKQVLFDEQNLPKRSNPKLFVGKLNNNAE